MNSKLLNVVYIGPQAFPIGNATSKRRRNMIDYMNNHGIQSHYLCCDFKERGVNKNPSVGTYGICDFYNITPIAHSKKFIKFWQKGKQLLKDWYNQEAQNILIFPTTLCWSDFPFFLYARKIGYNIIFDQVETSFKLAGNSRIMHKINIAIGEYLSRLAYKKSAAFVISSLLKEENLKRYPNRKICLLSNSTHLLSENSICNIHQPLRLLYSGTYGEKEGVKYLVEGVMLANKNGFSCELYLTGKGTPKDMEYINSLAGIKEIHYLGYIEDDELLQQQLNCDVLCMVRTNTKFANYGFPFKLSEYLATGRIVLATKVGDVEKYIKSNKSAYIIEPENSKAIANTIARIIKNPQEAITIAASGHQVMKDTFSIDRVGLTFETFLNSL